MQKGSKHMKVCSLHQPRLWAPAIFSECMQVQKAERAIVRAVEADKTDVDVDQIVKDLQEKVGDGWSRGSKS